MARSRTRRGRLTRSRPRRGRERRGRRTGRSRTGRGRRGRRRTCRRRRQRTGRSRQRTARLNWCKFIARNNLSDCQRSIAGQVSVQVAGRNGSRSDSGLDLPVCGTQNPIRGSHIGNNIVKPLGLHVGKTGCRQNVINRLATDAKCGCSAASECFDSVDYTAHQHRSLGNQRPKVHNSNRTAMFLKLVLEGHILHWQPRLILTGLVSIVDVLRF